MGRRWGIIPTRGVYQGLAFSGALTSGSSPLARGLRGPSPPACLDLGIIPARAGFTFVPTPTHTRIIPARAGFTVAFCLPVLTLLDHPRSRGVYYNEIGLESVDMGSSPLARGLPSPDVNKQNDWGIIPARAGFTLRGRSLRTWSWDHPRSRGVYEKSRQHVLRPGGSSPLARGLQVFHCDLGRNVRIIPARAGFTRRRPRFRSRRWDHPRSRGVYPIWFATASRCAGSSPLARGLRKRCPRPPVSRRIIPARAGFTRPSTTTTR